MDGIANVGEPAARLTRAVRGGDVAGVRELLARHPDLRAGLNQPMHDAHFGATALLAAVHPGNRPMAEVLLEAGADINQKSHWWAGGFGVLDGDTPLVSWLIERGARVDAYAAARHGMVDRLRALVKADRSAVRMRGGDGQTPLHVARTVEVAEFLLDQGAEIDTLDVDHESTPAMYALRERPEVARFLVRRGCRTDLLMAAALGETALVRSQLALNPADIRMAVTPAHFPMRDPRAGGTIYIWTLGANMTPHTVAHHAGHREVFDLLMAESPPELQFAVLCELGREGEARGMLAAHPRLVDTLASRDLERLPAAAVDNRVEPVRLMLEMGWPVGVRGQEGGTALHWAAFHGNAEMVRLLLAREPDLTLRDTSHDGTPLDWAMYGREHGWAPGRGDYDATIRMLKEASRE